MRRTREHEQYNAVCRCFDRDRLEGGLIGDAGDHGGRPGVKSGQDAARKPARVEAHPAASDIEHARRRAAMFHRLRYVGAQPRKVSVARRAYERDVKHEPNRVELRLTTAIDLHLMHRKRPLVFFGIVAVRTTENHGDD